MHSHIGIANSFLQSKDWLDFQRSIGRRVFEYEQNHIKAGIIEHDLPLTKKTYLYIPHGPRAKSDIAKNSAGNIKRLADDFKKIGREHNSIFIKAEPLDGNTAKLLTDIGFKKTKKEIQPKKTTVLDLTGNEKEILSRMHHKTRYNIKVAEKYNITAEKADDLRPFLRLLKKTVKRDKFSPHLDNYYHDLLSFFSGAAKTRSLLFIAEHQNKPAAGAIVLIQNDTGYYLHGASDYSMRAVMAPFMLHWHIIKFLKSKGVKYYDLWGIDNRRWPGVTRFKLGWGGQIIERPGSFDLSLGKLWYNIYNIARRIKKHV